jgi:hypothetical protein
VGQLRPEHLIEIHGQISHARGGSNGPPHCPRRGALLNRNIAVSVQGSYANLAGIARVAAACAPSLG